MLQKALDNFIFYFNSDDRDNHIRLKRIFLSNNSINIIITINLVIVLKQHKFSECVINVLHRALNQD